MNLLDIYATINQEGQPDYVDAALTAEILDYYQFFKKQLLLPWEEDFDRNKHLEARLRLQYEMKQNTIDPLLDIHFRYWKQRVAIQAQHEKSVKNRLRASYPSNSREMGDVKKEYNFHAPIKRAELQQELEFFAYPTVKKICPDLEESIQNMSVQKRIIAINKNPTILELWKNNLPGDQRVKFEESVEDALAKWCITDEIHLLTSEDTIKKQAGFVGDLLIAGIPSSYSTIASNGDKKFSLLAIFGNTDLQNLVVSCQNVVLGILIGSGRVAMRNMIFQSEKHNEGLLIFGSSVVTLENAIFQGFKCGIVMEKGAKLILKNCQIKNCEIGIKVLGKCEIIIEDSTISDSGKHAIIQFCKTGSDRMVITQNLLAEPERLIGGTLAGNCGFERNKDGDLCTLNCANYLAEGELCEGAPFFDSGEEN